MLVPSKKQFKRWTMLSRVGYLAAVVTFIVFAIQIPIWGYGLYTWLRPPPQKLSAADLLLIDQNPTKVEITNVGRERLDSGGEAVFLTLTNNSSVTAKNVRVYLYNHQSEKAVVDEPFANGYKERGVDIAANTSRQYKIASVDEYERFFNPRNPGARLLRVSTKLQDEQPFELTALACGYEQGHLRPCAFDSVGLSTVVKLRYGSIFGQKYTALTQFYNTFLQGTVEYLPDLVGAESRASGK